MKKLLCSLTGSLLAWTGALYGADVSGKWSGIAGIPVWVTFQQNGDKLTGTAGQTPSDQSLSFEDGKVDGDHLTFKAGTFLFDLRVGDREITGEVNMGGGETARVVLHRLVETSGPVPRRAFEVASVKRMPTPTGGYHSSTKLDPGRLTCTNITLRQLIVNAFAVKDYQVFGPDWMNSEVYDISATLPAGATGDQVFPMMQTLLAERFGMAFHREVRELPVYALVLAKGGSKLKPVEFGRGGTNFDGHTLKAVRMPVAKLADFLAQRLERPVLDMTELKGVFDFTLEYSNLEDSGDPSPDLMAALQQQLGLRLEARKAPVETILVDHLDKNPTEN
jgi:uncharacterized protein (TIGR03435 family)